ncbi:hypothetical protein CYK37_15265 [Mesorhizobium loti]|nr:calcium-binding protein [Mesorhizobium loti]PLP58269.1 hypothetical protein CYK37_15265 [Mesorhizobium loti]
MNWWGTAGNDTQSGTNSADSMWAQGGNDTIYGLGGNDTMDGGDGDDYVDGGAGNDLIWGGAGNDTILGGLDVDTIYGEGGNDTINGGMYDDKLYGGAGNDTFVYNWGDGWDTIDGGADQDTIQFGADYYTSANICIHSMTSIEIFRNANPSNYSPILRTDATLDIDAMVSAANGVYDVFQGKWYDSGKSDLGGYQFFHLFIEGWTGNDTISLATLQISDFAPINTTYRSDLATYVSGLGGDDTICTGVGADVIYGDDSPEADYGATVDGNDTIYAGAGNDELYGGGGSDHLYGEAGNDQLRGDAGDDHLYGGQGNDTVDGGDGLDIVYLTGDVSEWTKQVNGDGSISFIHTSLEEDKLWNVEEVHFDTGGPVYV